MADMTRDTTRDVTREEQLLRSAPLFGGMDIGSARSLMEKMTRSEVSKGDTIFNEGDDGQALYIIVRGKIKLARTARDGRGNLLGLLGVGDMLGELSVFDPGPRLARAHAVEDSTVYELPKAVLDEWLDTHLEMSRPIMRAPSSQPIALSWTKVFTLPPRSASTTKPFVAAAMRMPETRNSRPRMQSRSIMAKAS